MKQIIVMTAILILLLVFPLQYALEQRNYYKISEFQKYVYNAKEEAKVKGYFTEEIINSLKENICQSFKGIEEADIVIEVTETPRYRTNEFDDRELIYYKIGIPINQLIAVNEFWGISDEENTSYYFVESYTVSELIRP